MARNEAKIRFTAETSELTSQLRSANAALAAYRAGLKLNDAELKNNGDQTEYLKNKQILLQAELEANKQKQEALNGKLEKAKSIYGEDSVEVQSWTTKLTNARTEQQMLETELEQCTKALDEQIQAEQLAQTPLEQLNTKISEQKEELERLKTEYKNVALEQGTGSQEAQELKAKIDQLNSELGENEGKLKGVDDALEEAGSEAERSANGGWSILNQVIADLARNAIQAAINKLQEFARETMQLGIDFSSSMSNVQAISGATAEELDALEKTARELGSSTVFSASDVADAFGYMAMAGWDTQEMMAGVAGVLDLAAASGEDLATTSDIVTDALTAFGLSAEDSGHFADILAAASSNANTNVSMLGESFKYVAPVAGALGYSAEDVSVALGLMANSGIKAGSAGTALRTILTNMSKPTDEMAAAMDLLGVSLDDGNGNMKSFAEVMQDLRNGFGDLKISEEEYQTSLEDLQRQYDDSTITEEEYNEALSDLVERAYGAEGAMKAQAASALAGKQGMSGLLAIVNSSDEDFAKLTNAINDCDGAAGDMADTMNDNLGGDIKEMNSALDELKLKIFDAVENPMRNIVQFITTSVVPAATQLLGFLQQHSTALGVLAGVIGIIVTAMGVYNAVQAVQAAMNAAEAASLGALISAKLASAAASWAALAPYILIVAAIAAVIAIIVLCVTHWEQIKQKLTEVAEMVRTRVTEAWENLRTNISNVMSGIWSTITSIWDGIKSVTSAVWSAITTAITTRVQAVKTTVTTIFNTIRTVITTVINGIKSKVTSVFSAIKTAMTNPIETAKNTISGILNRIKGLFPLSIGRIFSNLKLPHISVSAGSPPFGIGGAGSLPSFHVDWYAKGVVFDAPTLIPTINGIKGVGEAGPEAVSPVSVLQSYIGTAVQKYVPQINYDLLAEKVAAACAKMNITIKMNDRELGRAIREMV